jgi:hypothetical protein
MTKYQFYFICILSYTSFDISLLHTGYPFIEVSMWWLLANSFYKVYRLVSSLHHVNHKENIIKIIPRVSHSQAFTTTKLVFRTEFSDPCESICTFQTDLGRFKNTNIFVPNSSLNCLKYFTIVRLWRFPTDFERNRL